jgi:hypothetical protein
MGKIIQGDSISVFATSFLPSISYFHSLLSSPAPIFDYKEKYIKQTERNRTHIMTANGIQALTVPVIKTKGNLSLTCDVFLVDEEKWKKEIWRSISTAYAHSPYFDHYSDELNSLIFNKKKHTKLIDYNESFVKFISDALELNTKPSISEQYVESANEDYRKFEFPPIPVTYQSVFDVITPSLGSTISILDSLFSLGPMARRLLIIG